MRRKPLYVLVSSSTGTSDVVILLVLPDNIHDVVATTPSTDVVYVKYCTTDKK